MDFFKTKYEPLPNWFDPELIDLIEKKRDRSDMATLDRLLDGIIRQGFKIGVPRDKINTHKHTWRDIEEMIEQGYVDIKASGYNPEVIVGIKSGGAFIAKYVANYFELDEMGYMRVSHYSDKSRSIVKASVNFFEEAYVSEECSADVHGKRVLLVDDQTGSGASLQVGKQYLLESGAAEVKSFCLFSRKPEHCDYFQQPGMGIYFPWGKDA